jgi:NADH dehydrogenase [ubiquinone] 1 alpha subcomplex assembly factor 7
MVTELQREISPTNKNMTGPDDFMNALTDEIRQIIDLDGPISLERFMAIALTHPQYGYYMNRDPFGAEGDFITGPEISQMFGELLGLWAAEVWFRLGAPKQINLIELGPGRGTLMLDALRAAKVVGGFHEAMSVHLVEASPTLRLMQEDRLNAHAAKLHWHSSADNLPEGPSIILANEFFDAMPACQYVKTETGWHERVVGVDGDGRLRFGLAPDPQPLLDAEAAPGSVLEIAFAGYETMLQLAAHVVSNRGALLAIDYGHTKTGPSETLQAMRKHAAADPLRDVGEADLTMHVDFANLARAASAAGAEVSGPIIQADFLMGLGLFERAAGLKKNADIRQAMEIDHALLRLAGTGQETGIDGKAVPAMGALFKVLGVASKEIGLLPGFEPKMADNA